MNKYFIASDHAGWDLKEKIKQQFPQIEWIDFGTSNGSESVDYPDFANQVAHAIEQSPEAKGILICGSGQGMAIRANKFSWIRAALVWSPEATELARKHNDANVLCIGSRLIPHDVAFQCLQTFINTDFEGGRHQNRVNKLSETPNSPHSATIPSTPRSPK
jgi:ribose 5-phosphate isomerase B